MIALGAHGYILKNAPKEEMLKAIDTILHGENYYSKEVYETIIAHISNTKPKQRLTLDKDLSEREKEVLRLIVQENSNQEIADSLIVSEGTVKTHVKRMLSKLEVRDRTQAVIFAYNAGIVQPDGDSN